MASSTAHGILGQKLFDGKTRTIYSVIDQPSLVCIHHKDSSEPADEPVNNACGRRASCDTGFRLNFQNARSHAAHSTTETLSPGTLATSITTSIYEILREASLPIFYVAPHPQSDMFIAQKCTMIPILWIIRRSASESYVKRHPTFSLGHRFVPPMVEVYSQRHPVVYRRMTRANLDETLESDRESAHEDDESDLAECISSVWSYEQLHHINLDLEHLKLSPTDLTYMYELSSCIFDIFEHIWMTSKKCQLTDLKVEFGMTTLTKEIVVTSTYDHETWTILRPNQKYSPSTSESELMWVNNALRDILDLHRDVSTAAQHKDAKNPIDNDLPTTEEEADSNAIVSQSDQPDVDQDDTPTAQLPSIPSATSRCIIVCSSVHDIEHGQKMKSTLNEIFHIQCDIRLCSVYRSPQTVLNFLSSYSYEHCRATVLVTLGQLNNGLAMCLSSHCQYPIIHCSTSAGTADWNTCLSADASQFTTVFTLPSAIHCVVQILAINDWRLWAKQRGKRFKTYMDMLIADQQLNTTRTTKSNAGLYLSH